MSNFNFNSLIIVQSLKDDDKIRIGEIMRDTFLSWQPASGQKVPVFFYNLQTLDEWNKMWDEIYRAIREKGIYPIIHLAMHGDETQIGIKGGPAGLIPLHELFDKVREANILTQNNVMLTMAVCKGINVIGSIEMGKPMPFTVLMASDEKLPTQEALDNFTIFYKAFFDTLDINRAKEELDAKGVNPQRYHLFLPEVLFMRVLISYYNKEHTPQKLREWIYNFLIRYGWDNSELNMERAKTKVISSYQNVEAEKYISFRNKFFMLDLFPDIKERFSLPDTFAQFKKYAETMGVTFNEFNN